MFNIRKIKELTYFCVIFDSDLEGHFYLININIFLKKLERIL